MIKRNIKEIPAKLSEDKSKEIVDGIIQLFANEGCTLSEARIITCAVERRLHELGDVPIRLVK